MEILANNMKDSKETNYDRAKKKVESIKGFYSHLKAFIIIILIIILIRTGVIPIIQIGETDMDFQRWLDWNIYLTPVLWGIVLIIHGLYVFRGKISFLKRWEDRKMNEFMQEEEKNENDKWKY